MKWVAAILMILNVVIFLGVSDREVQIGPERSDLRPDVNRDSMLLLKEVMPERTSAASGFPGSPTVVTAPDFSGMAGERTTDDLALVGDGPGAIDEPVDGAVLGASAPVEPTVEPSLDEDSPSVAADPVVEPTPEPGFELAQSGPELCYRVGPFKDPGIWQEGLEWAREQGIAHIPVRSQSRELRAVRVYIGPFESVGATQADVGILKEKELDYFVYLDEDKEARISLGYFTQEELAAKFVDYLTGQNISARSQPEYRTLGPFDWMDIPADAVRRTQVVDRDWGDEEILVTERDCAAG